MSNSTFSVADLLGRPGRYRDIVLAQPVPGARLELARADEAPVSAELRAESVVEGILVTGRLHATASSRCCRCLREVPLPMRVDVCELFALGGDAGSADEDTYSISGTDIDLEPMLRDALTLVLPLNPLCDPGCKGLCARCGHDLNQGLCGCEVEDRDPRWAALDELRAQLAGQEAGRSRR